MNTVIRHIEYLIAHKDCVIIPGIGAILATFENARIDKATSLLLPPRRVYTFNKDICHNDGTLACSIARAESIRYELACRKMEAEIDMMQHVMHTKGELSVGRIGTLRYDKNDGTIQFEPYAGILTANTSMWLPTLKLGNKISFVNTEKQTIKGRIAQSPIKRHHASILKRLSRLAAAIAIVAGFSLLATLLPVGNNNDAMKASLTPEFGQLDSGEENDISLETLTIKASDKYKDYSEIEVHYNSYDELSPSVDNQTSINNTVMHYVVVATLRTDEEAARYMSQHSGERLNRMPYKNLYIVYNSISSDKNEAYVLCREAVKKYPGAWIYSE